MGLHDHEGETEGYIPGYSNVTTQREWKKNKRKNVLNCINMKKYNVNITTNI